MTVLHRIKLLLKEAFREDHTLTTKREYKTCIRIAYGKDGKVHHVKEVYEVRPTNRPLSLLEMTAEQRDAIMRS